jgi:transcriptional regulator with XRE-family HTH domain
MLINLKVLLIKKGISQKRLAQAIGLSSGQLSRMVNEHVKLRTSHRRHIARFLGVAQSELFRVKTRSEKPRSLRQRIRGEGGGQQAYAEKSN